MFLKMLAKQLNVEERAFAGSELELVPAMKPREVGFDRGLILAYGHDDRICCYTALRGLLDQKKEPERTQVVFLADKEEIGSEGDTGMQSEFLELVIERLILETGEKTTARRVFWNSMALSADVGAGMDPNYLDVFEPTNNATIGNGIVIAKFTGLEASPEPMTPPPRLSTTCSDCWTRPRSHGRWLRWARWTPVVVAL